MSKASKDNGFLQLANELAEQFGRRAFKAQELAILFVVMRETYGYKDRGDSHPLTYRDIADATLIDFSDTVKHVKALLAAGVLRAKDDGLGINPHLDAWTVPERGLGKSPSRVGKVPMGKSPSSTGEIPQKSLGKSPSSMGLDSASGAASGSPKEKKETIKETLPPKGVSQEGGAAIAPKVSGLVALAQAAEWGEGEQDRFLSLTPYRKIRDLGIASGKTAELIKVYLAFSKETREAAWAYRAARMSTTDTKKPDSFTLAWLVGYLQDPSGYPAIAHKDAALTDAELSGAEPARDNPWRDKHYWRLFDPRFVDDIRPSEESQMTYLLVGIGNRYGLDAVREVNGLYRSRGIDAAMVRLVPLWFNQPAARKEANNG